ncbi:MAG: galactokinase [Acidobacteriota bacterium]
MLKEKIYRKFKEKFGSEPLLFKSPGRINLIGEHTDYNEGFVLPAAIDKYIYFAINRSEKNICNLYSYDLNEFVTFPVFQQQRSKKQWANYLTGVINEIYKRGKKLSGFDLVFGGNIPIGAGLSSSAALETGLAFALNKIFDLNFDPLELIKISQDAENNFVGVQCGIMDQFIAVKGKKDHFLKLDCRTLEYEYFPFDTHEYQLLLCNSNVKHNLADSEYNKRIMECEKGVKLLSRDRKNITKLRDVSLKELDNHKSDFPVGTYEKCSYVIEENLRLHETCIELKKNNLRQVGKLMYETHEGLKNKYNVSCNELDFLVDLTKQFDKIPGSRMMGGGFGGCTLNLIGKDFVKDFIKIVSREYKKKFNIEAEFYSMKIVDGTKITC